MNCGSSVNESASLHQYALIGHIWMRFEITDPAFRPFESDLDVDNHSGVGFLAWSCPVDISSANPKLALPHLQAFQCPHSDAVCHVASLRCMAGAVRVTYYCLLPLVKAPTSMTSGQPLFSSRFSISCLKICHIGSFKNEELVTGQTEVSFYMAGAA